MIELIIAAGQAMVKTLFEIILGSFLAMLVYQVGTRKLPKEKTNFLIELLIIITSASLGIVIPLGTYGLIPILAALLLVGVKYYAALPLILSNALFNILTPVNDPSFVWATGYRRLVFAFTIAVLAGVLLKFLRIGKTSLVKGGSLSGVFGKPKDIKEVTGIIKRMINAIGIYIIAGVLFNTLFHKYILWNALGFLASNPYTSFIPRFFAAYDVVNPFFLLAMSVVYLFMNFITMSAMLAILKPKGLVVYLGYHVGWVFLLGASAFI